MVEFNTLKPNWDNSKIKQMFGIDDNALDSERFYYITSEGKLAYIEPRVMNTAEAIAKVFYTLGLMDSERQAKEQIACGIVVNSKHLNELQASAMKSEAKQVLKDGIAELLDRVEDLLDEVSDKVDSLRNL